MRSQNPTALGTDAGMDCDAVMVVYSIMIPPRPRVDVPLRRWLPLARLSEIVTPSALVQVARERHGLQ